jgi:hypothetical protein
MQRSRQILVAVGLIGILAVLGAPRLAVALTCRAVEGGVTFIPPEIREVPAAAVEARGRKSATSSTTLTANGINLAAAIASTSANGRSATASPSVRGMGG